MRTVCVLTGSRSDYAFLKPVMQKIKKSPVLRLYTIATGMHLLPEFGKTIDTMISEGFSPNATVAMYGDNISRHRKKRTTFHYESLGRAIKGIGKILERVKPRFLVLLGDRLEALAGALAASTMSIAIAHIHGGDIASSGHIDESIRRAIAKFAHIHFAASEESAQRLVNSGEERRRVYAVGSPYADSILMEKLRTKENICAELKLDINKPVLVCIQHPTMMFYKKSKELMLETLAAVETLAADGFQTVVIYPNNDTGGEGIIEAVEEFRSRGNIKIAENLPHAQFLSLLGVATVLIGNSSCAFMEAHYFNLPAVNIGERNKDREKRELVVDCGYSRQEIAQSVKKALEIRKTSITKNTCSLNPTAGASEAIVKILSKTKINRRLLKKQFSL
ncbi:MAG: UDP-N-acetylglucosamine 2-epimerase [Planctomycetota bacterium]